MNILRRLIIALLIVSQMTTSVSYAVGSEDSTTSSTLEYCTAATSTTDNCTPLPEATLPAVELPEPPLIITSYMVDSLPVYLQVYNQTSELMALEPWSVNFTVTAADGTNVSTTLPLEGYIKPKSYLVISRDSLVQGADISFSLNVLPEDFTAIKSLKLHSSDYADTSWLMDLSAGIRYDLSKTDAGNYTKTQKFIAEGTKDYTPPSLYGGGYYQFADATALRVSEIFANPADCAPLDNGANCLQFVELHNTSDQPIDLAAYRLRLGYGNTTPTISTNIPLGGILNPDTYLAVATRSDGTPINITASGGNVWLEDVYGVHTYAKTIVGYQDIGDVEEQGRSYALDTSDNTWKFATPTPNAINDFSLPIAVLGSSSESNSEQIALKPCAADQYRNPETNRCKLIAITTSTFEPCAEGQYRSAETNRCRSLTSAVGQPEPCAANQYRNPETGRCKLIASLASDTLEPCAEGQERNPDTNRCRKVVASIIPAADFPVDLANETAKSFVGWYALGGVLMLGVGYGVLEWRHEIGQLIRKAATVVSRR